MNRLAKHASGRSSGALWLIAGIWVTAFAAMLLGTAVGSAEPLRVGFLRALLMAPIGGSLSLVLWLVGSRAQGTTAARFLVFAGGAIAATAAHVAIDLATVDLLYRLLGAEVPVRKIISNDPVRTFLMSFVVGTNLAVFALAHASFAMAAVALSGAIESRDRERQLAEAQAAASAAQLTALQYQLNPHFLFNTLNAIGSLVETGRSSEAGTMLDRLADFLRSTLAGESRSTTSLGDELATLQEYLEIESVRFGDRLRVEFECPADLRDAQVPTFILQPLVENALKHAVAPALRRVTVKVQARRLDGALALSVEDDGDRRAPVEPGTGYGVGFRNTRERLALLYGRRARFTAGWTDGGFCAAVTLPDDHEAHGG